MVLINHTQAAVEEDTAEEKEEVESDEEEQIVVLRQEEQLDPEAEADFDKEFEKMMAESLNSRKFERRAQFDVPLPIRKVQRPPVEPIDEEPNLPVETEATTMAFSLMTKKGNRQQASDFFHYFSPATPFGDAYNVTDHLVDPNNRTAF
jgi:regulator of nonsense transcripts 2